MFGLHYAMSALTLMREKGDVVSSTGFLPVVGQPTACMRPFGRIDQRKLRRRRSQMPKRIAVAVCPSPQDRNQYVVVDGKANNEYQAMRWLCENKLMPLLEKAGINAKLFISWPESDDDPIVKYQGLRMQMAKARNWLDNQDAEYKLVLSLHTDSGRVKDGVVIQADWPHTAGCIGVGASDMKDSRSYDAARIIAWQVATVFNHSEWFIWDWYAGFIFWQATGIDIPSVLIELFCHQSPSDVATYYANPDAVAQALVEGILVWAGAKTVTLDRDWLLAAIDYIRGRAEELRKARVSALARWKLAQEIQNQLIQMKERWRLE